MFDTMKLQAIARSQVILHGNTLEKVFSYL